MIMERDPDSDFYAWECFSLVRANHTTLDFVIKDMNDLMCFMHVMHHYERKPKTVVPA